MALTKVIGAGLGAVTQDGAATFNEGSADVDFRVESNANINMLLVDSGGEVVTIGGLASTAGNEDAGYFPLQVGNTGSSATIMQMLTSASGTGTIHFGDAVSGAGRYAGYMFYNHSNNSLGLGTSGVTQVTIDSTGAMTKPNQPAFLVKPASTQGNVAINTTNTVAFGTEVYDQNADFASNTFTAPVTGKYLFTYGLYVSTLDSAANYYESYLNTSNRIYYSTIDPDFGQDNAYFTFNLSVVADMDASDTADVKFFQSVGSAQTDISASSHFSGALIC